MKKGKGLILKEEEIKELEKIAKSRTEKMSCVERAKYILDYYRGESISGIAKRYKTNRHKVTRTIERIQIYGVKEGLNDLPRRGRSPIITGEKKAMFLNIACKKPKDLGLPEETWTMSLLAKYLRDSSEKEGYEVFSKISKGTVSKILSRSNIKPNKVRYYLEKRDADFEEKMNAVLMVYKEVEYIQESKKDNITIISYDAKPGIQAIGNVSEDIPIQTGKNPTILRDCHYRRHGTMSLLAGIDLLTGHIHSLVADRHTSDEFTTLLKYLNDKYPKNHKIKIILDNHSSHTSKYTQRFLKKMEKNRFEFIFTPKHGSWLNIIEVFFSKLTRCFLKWIRVKSKVELKERLLRYIDELNKEPVVFRWKYKLSEI